MWCIIKTREREKNEKIHQSKVIGIDSLSSQNKPIELESHDNNTPSPNKSSTDAFESQVSTKKCIISEKLGDDLNTSKKVLLEIFQNSLPQVNKTITDSDNDVDEITLKSTNNGGELKDEWLPILALLIQGR